MKTDLSSEIRVLPSTAPAAALTANAVTTGSTIDTKGFESVTYVVSTGVITDGSFTGAIFGGNQSNMSDERVLTAGELIGAAPSLLVTDDSVCERVGVNKAAVAFRYYRLKLTQVGATAGGFISAQCILGCPNQSPTAVP